jgi:hypothetical protein
MYQIINERDQLVFEVVTFKVTRNYPVTRSHFTGSVPMFQYQGSQINEITLERVLTHPAAISDDPFGSPRQSFPFLVCKLEGSSVYTLTNAYISSWYSFDSLRESSRPIYDLESITMGASHILFSRAPNNTIKTVPAIDKPKQKPVKVIELYPRNIIIYKGK